MKNAFIKNETLEFLCNLSILKPVYFLLVTEKFLYVRKIGFFSVSINFTASNLSILTKNAKCLRHYKIN